MRSADNITGRARLLGPLITVARRGEALIHGGKLPLNHFAQYLLSRQQVSDTEQTRSILVVMEPVTRNQFTFTANAIDAKHGFLQTRYKDMYVLPPVNNGGSRPATNVPSVIEQATQVVEDFEEREMSTALRDLHADPDLVIQATVASFVNRLETIQPSLRIDTVYVIGGSNSVDRRRKVVPVMTRKQMDDIRTDSIMKNFTCVPLSELSNKI